MTGSRRDSQPAPRLGPNTLHKYIEIKHKEQPISTNQLNPVSESVCYDTLSPILYLMGACP